VFRLFNFCSVGLFSVNSYCFASAFLEQIASKSTRGGLESEIFLSNSGVIQQHEYRCYSSRSNSYLQCEWSSSSDAILICAGRSVFCCFILHVVDGYWSNYNISIYVLLLDDTRRCQHFFLKVSA
jgi:hypothetical protein